MPYLWENKGLVALGIVSLIAVDTVQLFVPQIYKHVIDDLTNFRIDHLGLIKYALLILMIAGIMVVLRFGWWHCLIGVSRRIEEKLRNRLFEHIQGLSASYFFNTKTGDLMAHATNDIQHVRMAAGMGMVALNDALFLGTAAILFMAWINWRLTLLVLIPAPLIIISTRIITKRLHARYQDVQASFSDITELVRERYAGIRITKAFNLEQESIAALDKESQVYIAQNMRLAKISGGFHPLMIFFTNLSLAVVMYFGGRNTILGTITPGEFVAFISYLDLLTWPMMALGWVTNLMQRGKASLDRIGRILDTEPEIQDVSAMQLKQQMNRTIEFDQVSFVYGNKPKTFPALQNISFMLDNQQSLGITGPPGAGKTTLLSLIPRIFDVSAGKILIDQHDIRRISTHNLRSQISFMPQEPFLFAGTILENLIFSKPQASRDEIDEALKQAALLETIQTFPDELNTLIGEKGIMLSGGQKQRITLARLLLHRKPIIILDDPISQVDARTGNLIINTLRDLSARHTLIMVSHRLSALSFMDQTIVLDKGSIVESGTHEELLTQNGYYAKTWRIQSMAGL